MEQKNPSIQNEAKDGKTEENPGAGKKRAVCGTAFCKSCFFCRTGEPPYCKAYEKNILPYHRDSEKEKCPFYAKAEDAWEKCKQESIVGNFLKQETKRLVIGLCVESILLGYIIWAGNFSPKWFLLLAGLAVLLFVKMLTVGVRKFRKELEKMSDIWEERIQQDFENPHPIYKIFQGEIHLLPQWLIFRKGGLLHLVPLETVETVRTFRPTKTYGMVDTLVLKTDTMKTYKIEFFGRQQKRIHDVMEWVRLKSPHLQ